MTFHLVEPDPNFLYKLALPFAYVLPAGTPPHDVGTHPLPATGPYVIARYRPQHVLEFVRNRSFREWSKAAQPDGYPDEILFEMVGTPDQAVNDVIHGRADCLRQHRSALPSRRRAHRPGDPLCEPGALEHLPADLRPLPQHARSALRQSRCAQGAELRGRPRGSRPGRRRARRRAADVPDPSSALPGLPALLPVQRRHLGRRRTGRRPTSPRHARSWPRSGTRGMKVTFWAWAPRRASACTPCELLRSLGYRASLKVLGSTGTSPSPTTHAPRHRSASWRGRPTIPPRPASSMRSSRAPRSCPARERQRRRVLRPTHRPRDRASPGRAGDEPGRRSSAVGARRARDRRPGALGAARQPEDHQRPLEAGRQLPVQPHVADADRPALPVR